MRLSITLPKWKDLLKRAFLFWLRRYKVFFAVFFLLVALFGAYQWRASLVTHRWTPEERRAYLESTIKETVFDEKKFLQALEERQSLKELHEERAVPEQIIFPGGTEKELN